MPSPVRAYACKRQAVSQSVVLQEEKAITNDQDPTGKTVGRKTQAQSRGKWDSVRTSASTQGNQE